VTAEVLICYAPGCTFQIYHLGPHSHHISEAPAAVGDLVYEPSSGFYGRVIALAPPTPWRDGSDAERLHVEWRGAQGSFRNDPRKSEILVIRREATT